MKGVRYAPLPKRMKAAARDDSGAVQRGLLYIALVLGGSAFCMIIAMAIFA